MEPWQIGRQDKHWSPTSDVTPPTSCTCCQVQPGTCGTPPHPSVHSTHLCLSSFQHNNGQISRKLCGSPCSIQRSALYIGTKLSVRQSQSTVVGNECESSAFIELSCLLSCEPSKHTKLMDGRWCTPVGQSRDQCNHTSAPGYSLFYTLPEPMP